MKDTFAAAYLTLTSLIAAVFICIWLGIDMKDPSFTNIPCIAFYSILVALYLYSVYYSVRTVKSSLKNKYQ